MNGNREQANNFILDGLDNNQVSDNLVGYAPAVDAVQEFNEITLNAPAPTCRSTKKPSTRWAMSTTLDCRDGSPAAARGSLTLRSTSAGSVVRAEPSATPPCSTRRWAACPAHAGRLPPQKEDSVHVRAADRSSPAL